MADPRLSALGKKGWAKSGDKWIALISHALTERGIPVHMGTIELILRKTFDNNRYIGGNIGWQTIESYVGYLQATDQLGTNIKCHSIKFHRDRLNWAPRAAAQPKPFDKEEVFNGKRGPNSTFGTKLIRSKW